MADTSLVLASQRIGCKPLLPCEVGAITSRLRRNVFGAQGIETGLHYPVPIHRQPCLAHLDIDRDSYPEADRWANQGLSLPVFVGMSEAQQARVIEAVRGFYR